MPLRHIKPQAALVSSSRTQIGAQAMLRVGVGIGFRLSDPFILAHEAACWEAIKAADPALPLFEPAMPKLRAEWLLLGSAHYRGPASGAGALDWLAEAELGGVRKIASCRARPRLDGGRAEASLALDPRQAAAGLQGENPFGQRHAAPPLQRVRGLSVSPAPLAAMGPLGSDWPERRQWQPRFAGSPQAMADDGSHMGWPAATDLRFFQQAAPDQWSDQACWPEQAPYLLNGFRGGELQGRLPALRPLLLAGRGDGPLDERPELALQTVWLLPDADLGVMWWNGFLPLDYVLDDGVGRLALGFKDAAEPERPEALAAFAERRARLDDQDPLLLADHALMPDPARGWVWEQILDSADHPRFAPPPRDRAEIRARLERSHEDLREAQAAQTRLQSFVRANENALAGLPQAASDGEDWRARLQSERGPWSELTIRDADLSGLVFDGRELSQIRFERCKLDHGRWRQCRLEQVQFVDCSLAGTVLDAVRWSGGGLNRCNLGASVWNGVELAQLGIEDCRLDDIAVNGGAWRAVTVQGEGGAGGRVGQLRWDQVNWCRVRAEDWRFTGVQADGLGLVECQLPRSGWRQCRLLKFSALDTDLSASVWQRCQQRFGVMSHGSSLRQARLEDCELLSCSWQELDAAQLRIEHCACPQLHAQRLSAPDSLWRGCALDGLNATHAELSRARFEACALKDALFYGATLSDSRMEGCNLIDAKTAWMRPPAGGGWRGNLETGRQDWPRRAQ
ncbi:uncharacterized protein YjbI with pentapeptide repeats [Chromobacterium alkanivorans]|uniref:DUF2169 family type VI secretion system accessory protein n=1 Tax=Chromobacterium alkanivorans TaxID=1071719 RepID=UPI00216810E0|nr:DUF2169 domain-containing protein [Chromobacterium alkanivorans]MCS3806025.1 uncharacterized protein YjbI with pentapeptide repeats [Chromobacterium alkanivorans]MCS3820363.1 uncharacterized protein YjbI with pentapeptide repeats [Chromobacterium alkanivorans]MCS3875121.1 uncharacterized protein YjbI with pentapeptide repeats [Chromobacterium alkanivorans]